MGKTDRRKMEKPPFFARSNFRCLRGIFASRSLFLLIYTDREPGKGYHRLKFEFVIVLYRNKVHSVSRV